MLIIATKHKTPQDPHHAPPISNDPEVAVKVDLKNHRGEEDFLARQQHQEEGPLNLANGEDKYLKKTRNL